MNYLFSVVGLLAETHFSLPFFTSIGLTSTNVEVNTYGEIARGIKRKNGLQLDCS